MAHNHAQRVETLPVQPITLDNVDEVFDYAEWDVDQLNAGHEIREALKNGVRAILRCAPSCPDRSAAIRKLREARMDANSAITHRGKF